MGDYVREYKDRTPGSARLYARASQIMAGGVSHNFRYFAPYPLYVKKTAGSKIWDVDGNEYIDLWMGHYSHILGHKPEVITKVMPEIISLGTHFVNARASSLSLSWVSSYKKSNITASFFSGTDPGAIPVTESRQS